MSRHAPGSAGTSDASPPGFWAIGVSGRTKRFLMAGLVGCFALQSLLVYSDPPPGSPPLAEAARRGRRLWLRHNCQSCHQLYGFGGFLGPDLTNAAARVSGERLRRLLTEGSGRMPAFGMSPEEIAAVGAFLEAMNRSGQGQAKLVFSDADRAEGNRRLRRAIGEALVDSAGAEEAARGWKLFVYRGCQGCHLAPTASPRGPSDLLDVCDRLDRAAIMGVLERGRSPLMPPPGLSAEERETVYALLRWLGKNQYPLRRRALAPALARTGVWSEAPWWEFGR